MKKLLDLRFVIGLFFTLIGALLLGYQMLGNADSGVNGAIANKWSGVAFLLFGLGMIGLSYTGKAGQPEE